MSLTTQTEKREVGSALCRPAANHAGRSTSWEQCTLPEKKVLLPRTPRDARSERADPARPKSATAEAARSLPVEHTRFAFSHAKPQDAKIAEQMKYFRVHDRVLANDGTTRRHANESGVLFRQTGMLVPS